LYKPWIALSFEVGRLKVDLARRNLGRRGPGGYVLDRAGADFVDEADVSVFTGGDARDALTPVISGPATASRPRRPQSTITTKYCLKISCPPQGRLQYGQTSTCKKSEIEALWV
jgi:hypothetical protein